MGSSRATPVHAATRGGPPSSPAAGGGADRGPRTPLSNRPPQLIATTSQTVSGTFPSPILDAADIAAALLIHPQVLAAEQPMYSIIKRAIDNLSEDKQAKLLRFSQGWDQAPVVSDTGYVEDPIRIVIVGPSPLIAAPGHQTSSAAAAGGGGGRPPPSSSAAPPPPPMLDSAGNGSVLNQPVDWIDLSRRLPWAHTCTNTLYIPNYLLAVWAQQQLQQQQHAAGGGGLSAGMLNKEHSLSAPTSSRKIAEVDSVPPSPAAGAAAASGGAPYSAQTINAAEDLFLAKLLFAIDNCDRFLAAAPCNPWDVTR